MKTYFGNFQNLHWTILSHQHYHLSNCQFDNNGGGGGGNKEERDCIKNIYGYNKTDILCMAIDLFLNGLGQLLLWLWMHWELQQN